MALTLLTSGLILTVLTLVQPETPGPGCTHQWQALALGPGFTHQQMDTNPGTTTAPHPDLSGPSQYISRLAQAPGLLGPKPTTSRLTPAL